MHNVILIVLIPQNVPILSFYLSYQLTKVFVFPSDKTLFMQVEQFWLNRIVQPAVQILEPFLKFEYFILGTFILKQRWSGNEYSQTIFTLLKKHGNAANCHTCEAENGIILGIFAYN